MAFLEKKPAKNLKNKKNPVKQKDVFAGFFKKA
jgi:hypothetical protein